MIVPLPLSRHRPLHVRQRERIAQRGWRAVDQALRRPCSYRHPAGSIRRIETHISVIFLAGRYAYKLKKPVDLGFLDFTPPIARQRACEDEVRLNRRLAGALYCGVETIVRRGRVCTIGRRGRVVEHAVKMRRFDERAVFRSLLAHDALGSPEIGALADSLAAFHCRTSCVTPRRDFGSASTVRTQMQTVLNALERETGHPVSHALRQWCEKSGERLADHFEARRAGGFVRECHGDLHLANVLQRGKRALMFDCIEFSDALRWIDVASDLSFPLMDLRAHDRDDLAARLLNGWLQRTGDFGALPVLHYYMVYRALVRAIVAALKASGGKMDREPADVGRYLRLAERLIANPRAYLLLCHGYSGSGKSVASAALADLIGAIRMSSDTERKRARPLTPIDERTLPPAAYSADSIDRHYDTLLTLTRNVLAAGYPALVDATFLKREHRSRFLALAESLAVPVFMLDFHARTCVLAQRVSKRVAQAQAESDAGPVVLDKQIASEEPLSADERARTLYFHTEAPAADFAHIEYWQALLDRLEMARDADVCRA